MTINYRYNTGQHIQKILETTTCPFHKAPEGIPCFHVPRGDGEGYYAGVCNRRIKKAGFNGRINPLSIQLRYSRKQ